MKTCIDQVIHSVLRKKTDPINALYFGYNGLFESLFCAVPMTCYMPPQNYLSYEWLGQLPSTYTILPKGVGYIPNRIDVDVIICNSRRTQVYNAAQVADVYHTPLILIEHELPGYKSTTKLRQYMNSRLPKRRIHVVPHEIVRQEWCLTEENSVVIPYGVPMLGQQIRLNNVLVVGDYHANDRGLLETMMSCDSDIVGIGYNPGVTKPYTSISDIVTAMSQVYICVTATNERQAPILQLLAMSTGSVVVTNKTKWTEAIITDGKNGFIFDKAQDIKRIVRKLMGNRELMQQVAIEAQRHILDNYSQQRFIEQWQATINKLITGVYKR